MIEAIIYQRLASSPAITLLGGGGGAFSTAFSIAFSLATPGRLYNGEPTTDTLLPFVQFDITNCQPAFTLTGVSSVAEYEFTLNIYSFLAQHCTAIADMLRPWLDSWRDGNVQVCYLTSYEQTSEEKGFTASMKYSLIGVY